jgi:hypothetical protein
MEIVPASFEYLDAGPRAVDCAARPVGALLSRHHSQDRAGERSELGLGTCNGGSNQKWILG